MSCNKPLDNAGNRQDGVIPANDWYVTMRTEMTDLHRAASHPVHGNRGIKLKFLLVDDDDICQFIHRKVVDLSGYCHSADTAANGKIALDRLTTAANGMAPVPDIILLDLEMPEMGGIAFLEALRTFKCPNIGRIPTVLLTSSVSTRDREYAMSLGAVQCLSKPLTSEVLKQVVQRLFVD